MNYEQWLARTPDVVSRICGCGGVEKRQRTAALQDASRFTAQWRARQHLAVVLMRPASQSCHLGAR
jgi:hypothetical protein